MFPNADPFFHNVFSLFDGQRFDLSAKTSIKRVEIPFCSCTKAPSPYGTNLYPTPCTVKRCLGFAESDSSFCLSFRIRLSTVRVVG